MATLTVGPAGDFTTIQAAIDAAADGDTIIVAPGTYTEDIVVDVANLSILGAFDGVAGNDPSRGTGESILDGSFDITADGVTIDGMEISGSVQIPGIDLPTGGAVRASNVTLQNNVFDGTGETGARPFATSGTVTGLDANNNLIENWEEGVYIVNGHSGTIAGNLFDGNGNGVLTESTDMIVSGNTFQNSVGAHVGALPFDATVDVSTYVLADNIFLGQDRPVSIFPSNAGGMTVTGTVFNDTFRGTEGLSPGPFVVDTGAGNDLIFGSNLGDDITGGADNDGIDGANGTDTAFYSGNRADYEVILAGATFVVEDLRPGSPDGTDVVINVELFQFADVLLTAETVENAPGGNPPQNVAGVVWQDTLTGEVVTGAGSLGIQANTWEFGATGDFDGDGDSDIVWHNNDGQVELWSLAGTTVTETALPAVPTTWQIQGSGDGDGDGDDDIVWRHQDGDVVIWEMEDGAFVINHNLGVVPTTWQLAGGGDFDGDGDDDILWRHQDGLTVIWDLEDNAYVVNHNLATVPTTWQVEGTGDFDGDGDDDILWRHQDGLTVTWEMQNGALVTNHNLATVPNNYEIVGVTDGFDADADSDIVWQHQDGSVVVWAMQNGAIAATPTFDEVDANWQLRGTGEFPIA